MHPVYVWARLKSTMRSRCHVAILTGGQTSGETIPLGRVSPAALIPSWRYGPSSVVPADFAYFILFFSFSLFSPQINSCCLKYLQQLLNRYKLIVCISNPMLSGAVAFVAVALWKFESNHSNFH